MEPKQTPTTGLSDIDPETQKMLNTPVVNPQGISQEDEAFLNMVVAKVEAKEINLLMPSSLINMPIYEKLNELQQGKVDLDAFNLCSTLRTIYDLWTYYKQPTFQIENLVHSVRLTKESLEEISGDVYVI
ncbi:hypothetical protein KBD59_00190 [Candidatus Gracilibacteria bacterium]|nr:hypothetical protein [Candidatus Gracilibacteria bacterium]